jgi:hypothetical protein
LENVIDELGRKHGCVSEKVTVIVEVLAGLIKTCVESEEV